MRGGGLLAKGVPGKTTQPLRGIRRSSPGSLISKVRSKYCPHTLPCARPREDLTQEPVHEWDRELPLHQKLPATASPEASLSWFTLAPWVPAECFRLSSQWR